MKYKLMSLAVSSPFSLVLASQSRHSHDITISSPLSMTPKTFFPFILPSSEYISICGVGLELTIVKSTAIQ
jgi:hypothetical protein